MRHESEIPLLQSVTLVLFLLFTLTRPGGRETVSLSVPAAYDPGRWWRRGVGGGGGGSAQRIHLLEHMLQMTTSVPQTHLKPTSEVVNHPDTPGFLPDGTNLLCGDHFEFSNGLKMILIHVVLQEPPEIKIWCLRHSGGHLEQVL